MELARKKYKHAALHATYLNFVKDLAFENKDIQPYFGP